MHRNLCFMMILSLLHQTWTPWPLSPLKHLRAAVKANDLAAITAIVLVTPKTNAGRFMVNRRIGSPRNDLIGVAFKLKNLIKYSHRFRRLHWSYHRTASGALCSVPCTGPTIGEDDWLCLDSQWSLVP